MCVCVCRCVCMCLYIYRIIFLHNEFLLISNAMENKFEIYLLIYIYIPVPSV